MFRFAGILPLLFFANSIQAADQAPTDPAERARTIVEERCYLCHGMDGESASAIYPRLAAQHPEYLIKQLTDFREGRRSGTMNEMAADLTDEEIRGLADYFSSKPAKSQRVRDDEFAAVGRYLYHQGNPYSGVAACKSCHGESAEGTHSLPRLAGQNKRYLVSQLQEFNKRTRTNDNAVMHSIASKLTELEIQALALFISGIE